MKHLLSILFVCLLVNISFSQSYLDSVEAIYKTDKFITLDGNLDEAVWKDIKSVF
jgi:hypothetical protein